MIDNSIQQSRRQNRIRDGKPNLADVHEENEPDTSHNLVTKNGNLTQRTDDTILSHRSELVEPSQLHLLAINGNRIQLQEKIRTGKWNVNEIDHMGRTPLIYSVLGDRIDCVIILLKEGADINQPDVDQRTSLHWAAYQGNHKLVKLLLTKGANNIARDKEGRTPLHLSTSHDNIKVLQALLRDMNEEDIDTPDVKKMTALCWSVFYDRIEYIKLLLKHGASPTSIDFERRTVLHWTSENKDTNIIKLLLDENRTIINWRDCEGRTILHMAVGQSNYNLVEFLLSVQDIEVNTTDVIERTPLHWAAVLKNASIVNILLDYGADFSIGDGNGVRALHYASQHDDSYETVKVMLGKKGLKDIPDNEKGTALMWAAVKGCDKILELLIEKKCSDINAADVHMQTALHMSTQAGNLNCVKLLIDNGANVDTVDGKHHIPLFYACASGHAEIVTELLRHGSSSNLDDRDLEGRSPLHYAAMVDRTDIIKMLIQNNLSPNMKDNAGCPPLHFAAYGGFVHCMSVLLENGANVNIQDNDGRTALHWACRSGSLDAVKLLISRFNAAVNVFERSTEELTPLDYAILEDHQDVAFYLTENNAYTSNSLKDLSATKIQAVWKGYKFRRHFQEKRVLLLKHESIRRAASDAELSSLSCSQIDPQNRELTLSEKVANNDQNENIQQYADVNYLPEPRFNQRTKSASNVSVISHSSRSSYQQADKHQTKGPKFSVQSDNSVFPRKVSSSSTATFTPDNAWKQKHRKVSTGSLPANQGPKFSRQESNPLSLHKLSTPSSGYSDNKSRFRYPSYSRQTSDQVFYHGRDRTQSLWMQNKSPHTTGTLFSNNNRPSKSPVSSSDSSDVAYNLKKTPVDRNNWYNRPSYSRHVHEPQDSLLSTSSESSALFETKIFNGILPPLVQQRQKKVPNQDARSVSSISINCLKHGIIPQDVNLFPPTEQDKPWDIYRRDQKRINIIRQKTEAAIKIQRVFRKYLKRKLIVTGMPKEEASLSSSDTIVQGSVILTDSATFSGGAEFSDDDYNSSGEIENMESLKEVAALVIQLAWRQYIKNKLILREKNMEFLNPQFGEACNNNVPSIIQPPDSESSQFQSTNSNEDSDPHSSNLEESDDFDSSFEERKFFSANQGKKKLVSSASLPLMQNLYTNSASKKRSKFSLKKRFLQRTHNSHSHDSNALKNQNSPSLASVQTSLSKSDMSAIKTGKPKLFLRGKNSKLQEESLFHEK